MNPLALDAGILSHRIQSLIDLKVKVSWVSRLGQVTALLRPLDKGFCANNNLILTPPCSKITHSIQRLLMLEQPSNICQVLFY